MQLTVLGHVSFFCQKFNIARSLTEVQLGLDNDKNLQYCTNNFLIPVPKRLRYTLQYNELCYPTNKIRSEYRYSPSSFCCADEELGPVGVWSSVGH